MRRVFFLTFLILGAGYFAGRPAAAAPSTQYTFNPTLDVYSDRSSGNTTDGGALAVQGFNSQADVITAMKFDLTTVSGTVQQARLNMSVINDTTLCAITSDAISVSIYGMTDNTWDASSNFTTIFGKQAALLETITINPNANAYWTDTTAGDGLANYLNGLKGGTASLMLATTVFGQVWFEDNASSASICTKSGSGTIPVLQISTDGSPLSVELSNARAEGFVANNLVYILLGGLFITITGFTIFQRRRSAG